MPKTIEQILSQGVEKLLVSKNFKKRLGQGEKLRIKHGLDPTGGNIHIGRAVVLRKLRDFQALGHQIILIIGDFTALIGDASDKTNRRPVLSESEVKANLKDYLPQIGRLLDLKKTEVHYNSEWWKKMTALDLLKLAMHFTAQQMLARKNFKERWEKDKEIGLHEFAYPLLQGYDSVMVKADLELGGSDQLFNLVAGRKIQEIFGQKPQDIMTTKMLFGLDGRKMSTSWGNVVNTTDSPDAMFGKLMSMSDELIPSYLELAAGFSKPEIEKTLALPPREAKANLAKTVVSLYWGEKRAIEAEKEFNRVFKNKELPKTMPRFALEKEEIDIVELLVKTKLAPSKSEARRLLDQGAVKLRNDVLQVGKRKFLKLE